MKALFQMLVKRQLVSLALTGVAAFCLQMPAAQASTTTQVLDRLYVFSPKAVIDLDTNPVVNQRFTDLNINGGNLIACTLTTVDGLYCLDGSMVRRWENPTKIEIGEFQPRSLNVFSCADSKLGLDKGTACTGLTVDQSGAIWLAGKRKVTHVLIKVVRGTCANQPKTLQYDDGAWCAFDYYTGRPELVDITPVDGEAAESFIPCPGCDPSGNGTLGLELRTDVMFFPDRAVGGAPVPVVPVVPKRDWDLRGNEKLQEIALLQLPNGLVLPNGDKAIDNYILATTTSGRILAKNPNVVGLATSIFPTNAYPFPGQTASRKASCKSPDPQHYGIQVGVTSTAVYVSDRLYCQVLAIKLETTAGVLELSEGPLALSTIGQIIVPPVGLAVAPGASLDLAGCLTSVGPTAGCEVVRGADGSFGAKFLGLRIADNNYSSATVFQIVDIPDCRYLDIGLFPECAGAIIEGVPGPDGIPAGWCLNDCEPSAQWLNATPLLPAIVGTAFSAKYPGKQLPELLIPPQYRGQLSKGFKFQALFVVTEPEVRFQGTFTSEYEVPVMEGGSPDPDNARCLVPPTAPGVMPDLLAWDAGADVSEVYVSTGGRHVGSLTNIGCGSSLRGGVRISLLPYNLEITPDTYGLAYSPASPTDLVIREVRGNDAVFARLMQQLYGELRYSLLELACKKVDPIPPPYGPPLAKPMCDTLEGVWKNGLTKLTSCIDAAFHPKSSAGAENCQSFVSQIRNFQTRVPTATPAHDVANRTGELRNRVTVLLHLYETRFLPSIPLSGFCREKDADLSDNVCSNPWPAYAY